MKVDFFGMSGADLLELKLILDRKQMTLPDLIDKINNSNEYEAKLALYKARLARIRDLSIIEMV